VNIRKELLYDLMSCIVVEKYRNYLRNSYQNFPTKEPEIFLCTKIYGIKTGKTVFFTVSAMTVTSNCLVRVNTAVATRNKAIRCLKQDDEVEKVYKIATNLPLTEVYSL
jgi:hypothetical protein